MDYFSANAITALLPRMTYDVPYYGEVDLQPLAASLIVFGVLTFTFWALRQIVLERLRALSTKTSTDLDDALVATVHHVRHWAYTVVALYVSLQFLTLPPWLDTALTAMFLLTVVWQLIEVAVRLTDFLTRRFIEKDEDGDGQVDPNAATASDLVTLIARIALWSLGALFVLSNLGIEVTSLIAGLGIGGIAVAFALQGILSDLFASFSIYFDKPFRVGDFVVLGSDSGTVERIGVKSTRLRTLQGEELVVSNAELTTARVQNFKKMSERRIVTQFGITYETPAEQVRAVPQVVGEIFATIDGARLERAHFTSFGDSALIFEVVYNVESSDYTVYMDLQQTFNFALMDRFAALGIDFAYPTQTIYTKVLA